MDKRYETNSEEKSCSQTIISLLEEQVMQNMDKKAVVFEEKALTYHELNHKANQLAAVLKNIGVKNDQPVAIIAERSLEMIVGMCAVLKAGGAYVPIDPGSPVKRINFMLEDCKPKTILVRKHWNKLNSDVPIIDLNSEEVFTNSVKNPENTSNPEDLAYIMYTSGTSGKPKGCLIEQKGVIRLVKESNYITLNNQTTMLLTGAPTFDAATFEIWGSLLNGGTLYLIKEEYLTDLAMFADAIEKYRINTMFLTSALFEHVVNQNANLFHKITYLLTGGEVISEEHVRKFKKVNQTTRLIHCYGPTENTTFTTTFEIPDDFDKIPIGKAISCTQVCIMNGLEQCQPGEEGELCVTGEGVSRGYLNQQQLTNEKFIPNPMGKGRMYRTGDLAKMLPDGNLMFLGRMDEQVKIRGYRIEPDEIKNVLCQMYGIVNAVVTTKKLQNGELTICAYYIREKEISEDEIRTYLLEELPEYMVPAFLTEIKDIPLTNSGKVDYRALPDCINVTCDDTESESAVEIKLTELFGELLGRQKIGRKDNFFHLGGQSITAALAVSRMKEEFGVKLPLRDIFLNPSAEKLAFLLETRLANQTDKKISQPFQPNTESAASAADEEKFILQKAAALQKKYQDTIASWKNSRFIPLSPIQEISFQSGIKVSGMQMDFHESVDVNKLERVLIKIVSEYDVLRSFLAINETKRGMEVYEMENGLFLPYIELTSHHESIKNKVLFEIENFRNRYYDDRMYAGDTLAYQIVLVKLKEEEYRLYFSCTHLIFDGYSGDLLEGRISELYHSTEDVLKETGQIHSYENYTNKIISASAAVSQEELIQKLKLDKFVASLHELKGFMETEELECFCYTYDWKDAENIKEQELIGLIETVYDKALRYAFPKVKVPFFVIINGREYEEFQFFDELGELIDCMPFVFDGEEEENVFRSMGSQLDLMKKYNINYVGLMVSENLQKNYPAITNILMTIGMLQVNIPIFNYLIMYQDVSPNQEENIPQMEDKTAMNVSSICFSKNHVDMYLLCPKSKISRIKELLDQLLNVTI